MSAETGVRPIVPRHRTIAPRIFGLAAIGGVALFGLVSLAFVVRGRVNADEGWYLYAGRLVWRGELPFRDFSFTQMPLVPYVYGLFQLPGPSLYVGRVVSFAFATTAVALCVRVAWREAGRASAAAVAVLCLAFPTGIYNLTLTKTYALVAFFLASILAALTSPRRRTLTFPIATAAAVGLALTRTSGVPLAGLVVIYTIWRAPDGATRRRVALIAGSGAIIAGTLVLLDVAAARFDLSTFHQLLWHHASTRTRIDTILTDRIPEWASDYWGYLALTAIALLAVASSTDVRRYVRETAVYLMMTVGLVGYLGVQLLAGQWAPVEYAAPVVPVAVAMTIVLVFRWCFGPSGTRPAFRLAPLAVGGAVLALAVLTAFHPSASGYLVGDATPGTIAAADRVAGYLRTHTKPSDEVLALWGQPATFAADRDLVRDATFGIFSYEDLTTHQAKDLHYVNQRRLVELLESGTPAAVVVTDLDRVLFGRRGSLSNRHTDPDAIPNALTHRYRKMYSDTTWGTDGPIGVDVYLRDDRAP